MAGLKKISVGILLAWLAISPVSSAITVTGCPFELFVDPVTDPDILNFRARIGEPNASPGSGPLRQLRHLVDAAERRLRTGEAPPTFDDAVRALLFPAQPLETMRVERARYTPADLAHFWGAVGRPIAALRRRSIPLENVAPVETRDVFKLLFDAQHSVFLRARERLAQAQTSGEDPTAARDYLRGVTQMLLSRYVEMAKNGLIGGQYVGTSDFEARAEAILGDVLPTWFSLNGIHFTTGSVEIEPGQSVTAYTFPRGTQSPLNQWATDLHGIVRDTPGSPLVFSPRLFARTGNAHNGLGLGGHPHVAPLDLLLSVAASEAERATAWALSRAARGERAAPFDLEFATGNGPQVSIGDIPAAISSLHGVGVMAHEARNDRERRIYAGHLGFNALGLAQVTETILGGIGHGLAGLRQLRRGLATARYDLGNWRLGGVRTRHGVNGETVLVTNPENTLTLVINTPNVSQPDIVDISFQIHDTADPNARRTIALPMRGSDVTPMIHALRQSLRRLSPAIAGTGFPENLTVPEKENVFRLINALENRLIHARDLLDEVRPSFQGTVTNVEHFLRTGDVADYQRVVDLLDGLPRFELGRLTLRPRQARGATPPSPVTAGIPGISALPGRLAELNAETDLGRRNAIIEAIALDAVRADAEQNGWDVEDYSIHHRGYDLKLVSRADPTIVRYVEVKGTRDAGAQIQLSPRELEFAQANLGSWSLAIAHIGEDGQTRLFYRPLSSLGQRHSLNVSFPEVLRTHDAAAPTSSLLPPQPPPSLPP